MEIKLCRICGKQDDSYIHIFKTEGLKNKIETCLPIVVTQHCPLPATICTTCLEAVDNFYSFIKSCLQNIIVLEAQYEIVESCLKTKRKVDKSVSVDPCDLTAPSLLTSFSCGEVKNELVRISSPAPAALCGLVDYDCSSDSDDEVPVKEEEEEEQSEKVEKLEQVDEASETAAAADIIGEIAQRKRLKRKLGAELVPMGVPAKQARKELRCGESSSRRKSSRPKRVEYHLGACQTQTQSESESRAVNEDLDLGEGSGAAPVQQLTCLLCDQRLPGPLLLAAHVYEIHGIDLTQVYGAASATAPGSVTTSAIANVNVTTTQNPVIPPMPMLHPAPTAPPTACRNRKIPELVKISDVLTSRRQRNNVEPTHHHFLLTDESSMLEPQTEQSVPQLNHKNEESQQQQQYVCGDCPTDRQRFFDTFSEFSTHRRAQHQIFHCDLCPKFYGRNSHLWKHVNRVHKGHAAITCRECGKTSASEYHLAQHRNKMHASASTVSETTVKHNRKRRDDREEVVAVKEEEVITKTENVDLEEEEGDNAEDEEVDDEDDLLNQKFQGFDFKSVRQSFLRQELMNKRQRYVSVLKKNNVFGDEDGPLASIKSESVQSTPTPASALTSTIAPKEIDTSSDLYTTIITNYTPPSNEGPYKCPKCFKGFHKKNLLKKHKKNCRPRLQKDLLTRCKTCSRIFKDRQSLAKHLVNYHSEYTCEICSVAVQSKCEIVSHIRFTHPGSELHCHCGQILRSREDLARHRADHRDSHVCQFCGDALPTKIKLKMHILSLHRKILALSCGICLRLFESQHILRAHVRHAHADQLRPLTSCTVCGKNYGSKWKTYDHLNKSHGRIFKACKACLEVFETERELQDHFEKEHVNNSNANQSTPTTNGSKSNSGAINAQQRQQQQQQQQLHRQQHQQQQQQQQSQRRSVASDQEGDESGGAAGEDEADTEENDYISRELQTAVDKRNGVASSNRLSLLEKRLLGKRATEDTPYRRQQPADSNKNGSSSEWAEIESGNGTSSGRSSTKDDILQNSSKRTVYVNSNDPSLCEICLKVWPAKKHLWQHYIRCHKQTAATVCGICLKTNPSYSALQRHLRDTHPRLLHGCGFGSNFICKICGRYHNASSKLRLHMAIHVGYGFENDAALQQSQQQSSSSDVSVAISAANDRHHVSSVNIKREVADDEPADEDDDDEVEESDEDDDERRAEEDEECEQKVKHESQFNDSDEEVEDEEDGGEDDNDSGDSEVDEEPSKTEEEPAGAKNDMFIKSELQEIHDEDEDEDVEEYEEGDINYESMIEEVEASDGEMEEMGNGAPSSSDDEDDTNGLDKSDIVSEEAEENDMEQEMLKNMIGESRSVRLLCVKSEEGGVEQADVEDGEPDYGDGDGDGEVEVEAEYADGEEEDEDGEDEEEEEEEVLEDDVAAYEVELVDLVKNEPCSDDSDGVSELDSAIRSICDGADEEDGVGGVMGADNDDDAYRRLIRGRVNESELETAVGSIL